MELKRGRMQENTLLTQRGIPDRQPRLNGRGPDLARCMVKSGPRPFQAEPPSWLKVHGFSSVYFHGTEVQLGASVSSGGCSPAMWKSVKSAALAKFVVPRRGRRHPSAEFTAFSLPENKCPRWLEKRGERGKIGWSGMGLG